MQALGLDREYGAYLDLIPASTLATVNLMSLFGLHRRWRGAIVGHLALFEMTSSIPNRRYGDGLRRLGFDGDATRFFDEHVEADAVHENIAAVDLAGGLLRQEPELCASLVWGAETLALLDTRWAAEVLTCWRAGRASLLRPLGVAAEADAPALASWSGADPSLGAGDRDLPRRRAESHELVRTVTSGPEARASASAQGDRPPYPGRVGTGVPGGGADEERPVAVRGQTNVVLRGHVAGSFSRSRGAEPPNTPNSRTSSP
jgi:hypothetical protein